MTKEEIDELEAWFADRGLPARVDLNPFEIVVNPRLFVSSHVQVLREIMGERAYLPYYHRLLKLKELVDVE